MQTDGEEMQVSCTRHFKGSMVNRKTGLIMSRELISYRRLVVSCSEVALAWDHALSLLALYILSRKKNAWSQVKVALDGSIIVEICDETMRKVWRKPVKM